MTEKELIKEFDRLSANVERLEKDLEYQTRLAEAALAYIEQISTNPELNTQEKRERLDSWKNLQIIKSKQYCTCEAPIVRFDGEEYCRYCQKVIL